MAKDVDDALTTIIRTHGGMSDGGRARLQAGTGRGQTLRARRVLTRDGLGDLPARAPIKRTVPVCPLRSVDSKETSMRRRMFLAGGAGAVVAVSALSVVACSSPASEPASSERAFRRGGSVARAVCRLRRRRQCDRSVRPERPVLPMIDVALTKENALPSICGACSATAGGLRRRRESRYFCRGWRSAVRTIGASVFTCRRSPLICMTGCTNRKSSGSGTNYRQLHDGPQTPGVPEVLDRRSAGRHRVRKDAGARDDVRLVLAGQR